MKSVLFTSIVPQLRHGLFIQTRLMSGGKHSKICALIVGAPGCGKGTISNWIVRDFGLKHVSSGDLFRQHINEGTDLGKKAKGFMDSGNLVPDDVVVKMMTSELQKIQDLSWLLDGFPRTKPQAIALQEVTPVNVVINIDVPFKTIIDRVKDRWIHPGSGRVYNTLFSPPKVAGKDDITGEDLIQREDDKPVTVLARLEKFSLDTQPVLEFYRQMGICKDFQGTESKKIWPHVEAYLKSILH